MLFTHANYYYNFGFNVTCITGVRTEFNLHDNTLLKAPSHEWTHFQNSRQSLKTLRSYDWDKAVGLGVVLGYKNLRALDIDGCTDFEIISDFLDWIDLPYDYKWVVKSGSNEGFHILFFCEQHKFNVIKDRVKAFKPNHEHSYLFKHVELRWQGHLVLPPSVHPSSMVYEFFNEIPTEKPLEIKLEDLYRLLNSYCRRISKESKVYVAGDNMGNIITVSNNNPEYGWITLKQEFLDFYGDHVYETRSHIIMSLVSTLEQLNLSEGEVMDGRIVIREQIEPFSTPDRDVKRSGVEGPVLTDANGNTIYRRTFFVSQNTINSDPQAGQDILIPHNSYLGYGEAEDFSEPYISELHSDDYYYYAEASDHSPSHIDTYIEPYYLFFDTETTGVPNDWNAPASDLNNWPRLVQLAYLLYDAEGVLISSNEYIIRPEGFEIPQESSNIHGITNDYALSHGQELTEVLSDFEEQCKISKHLVAHNINFDSRVMGAEFLRKTQNNPLSELNLICTMEGTVDFCKIEGYYGYKWPKLSELYMKLFGVGFDNAHNARADIEATARCFWELKKRGLF